MQQTSFAKDLLCVAVIILNTLLYDIILLINCYSFLAKNFGYLKSFRSNFGSFQRGGCDVYVHVTRSQLQLKQARCKISNKEYLSLNIFVILCHNKLDLKVIAFIRSFVDESHEFLHLRNYSRPGDGEHSEVHEVHIFWPRIMQISNLSARLQANSLVEHANRKLKTEIHTFQTILSIQKLLNFDYFFLILSISLPQVLKEILVAEFCAFPNQLSAFYCTLCQKKFCKQNFT